MMNQMTWEETIEYIRKSEDYKQLVVDAYFSKDLVSNVEKYRSTEEFRETLKIIKSLNDSLDIHILDLGAGNGISSIAFALEGYRVTALEPDKSETIGAGAIQKLADYYNLDNVSILTCYAEDIPKDKEGFDIVFARQAMHHAYHLDNFIAAAFKVLKKKGILFTIRDHVVSSSKEKEIFLKNHPLHKYYGGENAFSLEEYKSAMEKAGFEILKVLDPGDSTINFYPWSKEKIAELIKTKFGQFFVNSLMVNIAWKLNLIRLKKMPGRLYSFIAIK